MFPSPNNSRPVTGASIASTSSSYSLPDALPPMPGQGQQRISQGAPGNARNRAPLGPPPSARRGPSYYYPQYPQLAYVSPIVEESDSQRNSERGSIRHGGESRGSYASSNAIPIGVSDFYLNNGYGRGNVDSYMSEFDEQDVDLPPKVTESSGQDSPTVPIRQASLGKRSKPTLKTIKSGDVTKPEPTHQRALSDESIDSADLQTLPSLAHKVAPRPALGVKQSSDDSSGNVSGRTDSSDLFPNEPTFLERSSSESDKSDFAKYKMLDYTNEPLPARALAGSNDPRVESILNRLEKGGALPAMDEKKPTSLSQRVGTRRPPPLDVDAVRDAEQRGSLTSLPDLIRRATKLASNLDRGKTASRLGFDWMLSDSEKQKALQGNGKRRSGSLSDMISAFPPPAAIGTPISQRGSGRFAWPSHLRNDMADGYDYSQPPPRQKRRVCGMPLWVFLLLILLLVLLIAAAIIVPVALIVIPHQNQAQKQTLASCQQSMVCANGGTNILGMNGACRCICQNGFTGSTCGMSSGSNCTTTSVVGASGATVGSAIAPVLSSAASKYSVPLYGEQIVSLLSAANLTCLSENSLMSFGGVSARSVKEEPLKVEAKLSPTKTLQRRQTSTPVSPDTAATSDGIVFATGTPSSSSGTGSTSAAPSSQVDFARVAVLFVLQVSSQLNDALAAQMALERAIGTSGAGNVTLSNGYSADLNSMSITVQNGTMYGKGA